MVDRLNRNVPDSCWLLGAFQTGSDVMATGNGAWKSDESGGGLVASMRMRILFPSHPNLPLFGVSLWRSSACGGWPAICWPPVVVPPYCAAPQAYHAWFEGRSFSRWVEHVSSPPYTCRWLISTSVPTRTPSHSDYPPCLSFFFLFLVVCPHFAPCSFSCF